MFRRGLTHWQLRERTRIILGTESIRPTERAALYLQTQVEKRSGLRWEIVKGGTPGPGDIVLGIPGDGTVESPLPPRHPEEIALWCGGDPEAPSVYVLAGGPSVVMAAAGSLARALHLKPGKAALPSLSERTRPAFPVRGHTFANHKQNNTYDKWDWEHWEEYLTEIAAWGNNIAIFYPLHPTRWQGSLPFEEGPWFDNPEREKEFYRQLEIQLKIPDLCRDLGMRYGIWLPVNDVFPEETLRHPEITKYGRSFVCPHIPEARRQIRAIREKLFSMLPYIDVLFLPSRDDGGCPGCEDCTPWGPVYLELVKEQTEQVRRYHPHCKLWLSQQGLTAEETQGLLDWLDRERPDWVEGVAYGPFGEVMTFTDPEGEGGFFSLERYRRTGSMSGSGPVNRLRAALPGQYRLILYPDETHTYRCQYPVIGMDPAVQYVWNREDGPAPRPREMAVLDAATSSAADGSIPYSEGNTDDLNKFIWSAQNWNPDLSAEDVVSEYVEWFFGSACAKEAAALIFKTEEALNAPIYGSVAVKEAQELLITCESQNPGLLDNWRWLNLRIGVLMLDYIRQVVERDRKVLAQLRYRVAVWRNWPDPTPGLRETIGYLEELFRETEGAVREIVWTRDKLFAMQKLAIRGVAKLQNSYMGLDVLLQEWKEILSRMEQGELRSFPDRYRAIMLPLQAAEDRIRLACKGIPLVEHIQEFAWEKGAST